MNAPDSGCSESLWQKVPDNQNVAGEQMTRVKGFECCSSEALLGNGSEQGVWHLVSDLFVFAKNTFVLFSKYTLYCWHSSLRARLASQLQPKKLAL